MVEEYDPSWYKFPDITRARAVVERRIKEKNLADDQIDEWLCDQLYKIERNSLPITKEGKGWLYREKNREIYCAINILLNERRRIAPRFRPSLPVPPEKKDKKPVLDSLDEQHPSKSAGQPILSRQRRDEDFLANDKKVIDLHWLWVDGKRDKIEEDREFYNLFDCDPFNWEQAQRFAAKRWRTRRRVEILRFAESEQWGLASLLSAEAAKEWESIQNRVASIEKILRRNTEEDKRLSLDDANDFKKLWVAVEVTNHGSYKAIAKVFSWITRKPPLEKSTMSGKLKRMRTWTKPKQNTRERHASRKSS